MKHQIRLILVTEHEGELIDNAETIRQEQALARQKRADWIRFERDREQEFYDYLDQVDHELYIHEMSKEFDNPELAKYLAKNSPKMCG